MEWKNLTEQDWFFSSLRKGGETVYKGSLLVRRKWIVRENPQVSEDDPNDICYAKA
jgi:hypothetical protein